MTQKLVLIGVTGTNGKSTVTHIIAQWNQLLNNKTGIMGTLGNGIYNNLKPSLNTTESYENIQKFLKKMLIKNIKTITMEISSHGIVQNRIANLQFSIAILTNVTSDHLDYHKNFTNYAQSKWHFLSNYKIKTFIINVDDYIGKNWIKTLPKKNTIAVSIQKKFNYSSFKKWIFAYRIVRCTNYTYIYFNSSWGSGLLKSKLIGLFNVTNLLLALAALLKLGNSIFKLTETCKNIIPILGRMQTLKVLNKPLVIIDYAHNEDAFKNVLKTIRNLYHHRIWCIFGCGGERDTLKRPFMGKIAENITDKIILTNDNPRNENPIQIFKDIVKGCNCKKTTYIIPNRKKAIYFAIKNAKICDCIAILGKGHEKYQIINNKNHFFSDYKITKNLLRKI